MNYLKTAALCTTAGSVFGNFYGRPQNLPILGHLALRAFFPNRSVGLSRPDPNNPNVNIINTREIRGYDYDGSIGRAISKHIVPDFSLPNKNDYFIMGISTIAPLLISGFLQTSLRDSIGFHIGSAAVTSGLLTFLDRTINQPQNKQNKTPL